jgi:hypothetical protein
MIRNRYYFLSVFIVSIILALLVSLGSVNFMLTFLIFTAIFFIIVVSITVFPFVYYNHFSELRVLGRIPKYSPEQIVNIMDADAKFNMSVRDDNFQVVPGLIHEKYIDAKAVFLGNYLEFYQYASPYVLSYIPFLKINSRMITELSQGKHRYSSEDPDLISRIKCNFFEIMTEGRTYRLIVLHESTDKFISALINSRKSMQT